jgi:hypothetical protein
MIHPKELTVLLFEFSTQFWMLRVLRVPSRSQSRSERDVQSPLTKINQGGQQFRRNRGELSRLRWRICQDNPQGLRPLPASQGGLGSLPAALR